MIRKFLPRIHLATALIVTVAAGVLLGLNLNEQHEKIVWCLGFNSADINLDIRLGKVNRSDIYTALLWSMRSTAGWPMEAYHLQVLYPQDAYPDASPLLPVERDELTHVNLKLREWTAQEFEAMAPTIFSNVYHRPEIFPSPESNFIDFSGEWNRTALTINISTALGILISLAALSELLIRRHVPRLK